jgi:hypothetical protein
MAMPQRNGGECRFVPMCLQAKDLPLPAFGGGPRVESAVSFAKKAGATTLIRRRASATSKCCSLRRRSGPCAGAYACRSVVGLLCIFCGALYGANVANTEFSPSGRAQRLRGLALQATSPRPTVTGGSLNRHRTVSTAPNRAISRNVPQGRPHPHTQSGWLSIALNRPDLLSINRRKMRPSNPGRCPLKAWASFGKRRRGVV